MLHKSSVHSRKSGKIMMMLPSPATKIYFTACHHLVSSSIQTLYHSISVPPTRQLITHDFDGKLLHSNQFFPRIKAVILNFSSRDFFALDYVPLFVEGRVRIETSSSLAPLA